MSLLIRSAGEYDAARLRAYDRPAPAAGVLVSRPSFFQVREVQNPHMAGRAGTVDAARAEREWEGLLAALREAGLAIHELSPLADLPDLCFTANPSLAGLDRDGRPFAVVSRMRHATRRQEAVEHAAWYQSQGVSVVDPWGSTGAFSNLVWEGGGDCLWHPGRFFLWAGHGQRSVAAAHERVAAALGDLPAALGGVPMALLRLVDPAFYHLDTCLQLLDPETAAWVPAAFDEAARGLITTAFPRLLEVDEREARERLAANLYCPGGRLVLLPAGSPRTAERLERAGFAVREVALDEFSKSGGSVFCLRQELPLGLVARAPEGQGG